MISYLAQVPHSATIIDRVEVNLIFPSFTSCGDSQLHTPVRLPVQKSSVYWMSVFYPREGLVAIGQSESMSGGRW
jgi:hypothetical protein